MWPQNTFSFLVLTNPYKYQISLGLLFIKKKKITYIIMTRTFKQNKKTLQISRYTYVPRLNTDLFLKITIHFLLFGVVRRGCVRKTYSNLEKFDLNRKRWTCLCKIRLDIITNNQFVGSLSSGTGQQTRNFRFNAFFYIFINHT